MRQRLLNALLFLPSRAVRDPSALPDLAIEEIVFEATDGERLHGWWVAAQAQRRGHVLLCHGNGATSATASRPPGSRPMPGIPRGRRSSRSSRRVLPGMLAPCRNSSDGHLRPFRSP
jgi:hypothetical protein